MADLPRRRRARALRGILGAIGLAILLLAAAPFAHYAVDLGWRGLTQDLWPAIRFDAPEAPLSVAVFAHMITGGLITCLAPLQLSATIRARAPALHRAIGRLVVLAACATALTGLAWIAANGTIGGADMSLAFALYGALMAVAALQTLRAARARALARHRAWALRLVVLAMASWLYRVHYGIWFALTGGVGSTAAFTGLFDKIQVWAFYLPYLALLELILRRQSGARRQT
ncbi:MAG: DUF2306 domain-containing protein [Pseudomonadota bacterium]